ncbi:Guanine nucleotide-binding protein subunit beta (pfGbeta1) (G protein subunit beta-1), partial [Durusdinium trenchii]
RGGEATAAARGRSGGSAAASKMGEIQEVKEKLAQLKAELAAVRDAKNDGSFSGQSQGSVNPIKARRVLKGHFGKVYSMHWAGSGSEKLVSASQDGKLIIWNGNTTNKIQAIPLRSSWVMTCAFEQSQNKLVACGGLDNMCSIYTLSTDTALNRATCELAAHDGYLSCCRFLSPSRIITSSGDSTCILWNVDSNQVISQFTDHAGDVMSVSPSPNDPNIFVSGSCDATCKLWDIRTQRAVITFDGHESDINDVTFFPDGTAFGTGSDDSSCRLYDLRAYQQINIFHNQSILCGITSVAFSSSGRLLIGGYDDFKAHIWDTLKYEGESVSPVQVLSIHDNRVSCVGVQKDGQALCTGSWDTLLRIFA